MRQLFRELKRRNVYKVGATYAAVAFVTLQAARLVFPATTLEGLYDKLVVVAFVGFPFALVIAWAFELTPEGVRRTAEPGTATGDEVGASSHGRQRRLALTAWVGLGLLAAAVAGGWYLMGSGGEAPPLPHAGERSIAVLPFEPLSAGEESRTFARGIHDDLLTRLAHVSGLKVISRTAVEQYRDTDLSTGEVADSLGVSWVMEGGVQVLGDRIQVNAQLIDPRTETHAWADRYQRSLTAEDLFALQGEITKRIARSLEAELTPEETRQVERQPTGDLDAYRLYVKGRDRLDTRTEAGMRDAVDYFRRAIRQDSTYALAWAGLADAIGLFAGKAYATPEDSLPDHEATARRALELGPDLAEAHASMGFVRQVQGNGPAALQELKRAVELKPSYAQAHHWLGFQLFDLGRLDPAREHVSLAVELDPRHWAARGVLINVLLAEGEVETARAHLRQLSDGHPQYPLVRSFVLYHAEEWDELASVSRRQLEQGKNRYYARFHLARAGVGRGDTAVARAQLAKVREDEPSGGRFFAEGLIHAALDQPDSTFSAWRRAREAAEGARGPAQVLRYWYPDVLDPVRDDPRYRELIAEINRAWGLNPDGSLPDSVEMSFEVQPEG